VKTAQIELLVAIAADFVSASTPLAIISIPLGVSCGFNADQDESKFVSATLPENEPQAH
jgi:hypothetical protein